MITKWYWFIGSTRLLVVTNNCLLAPGNDWILGTFLEERDDWRTKQSSASSLGKTPTLKEWVTWNDFLFSHLSFLRFRWWDCLAYVQFGTAWKLERFGYLSGKVRTDWLLYSIVMLSKFDVFDLSKPIIVIIIFKATESKRYWRFRKVVKFRIFYPSSTLYR